jgi:type IV fimbrial biogenesis protein FimT
MSESVLSQRPRSKMHGFTLVELMITLAVMAIVAAIAVPSMQSSRQNALLRTTTNDLVMAINTARSQALNRRIDVQINAAGGDWSNGWAVQYDYPASTPMNQREPNINVAKNGEVVIKEQNGITNILFRANGFVDGGEVRFELCGNGRLRVIQVSPLGKIMNDPNAGGACS